MGNNKKENIKFSKFTHKTKHLPSSEHQLDPNIDLKHLVHHSTKQYVDRDADGDVDIYDNPNKKIPDENVMSAPVRADVSSRKLISKQKGELKHTRRGMAYEQGNLHQWFKDSKSKTGKPGWVDVVDGDACAREEGETATPKCVSSEKRNSMSKSERLAAQRAKRREDPNQPEKSSASKPTYVKTDRKKMKEEINLNEIKDKPEKGSGKKDACYKKVKSRYSVWPSAYASGALVKCRKVGASNWGVSEEKDHEHSMIRSQLSTIKHAVKRLQQKMKGEGNVEAWVQSKITKASDYLDSAADYVDSGEMTVENIERGPILPKEKGKRVFPPGKGPKKTGAKLPNIHKESTTIEDANGNSFLEIVDIISLNDENIDEACWKRYKQVGMKKKGKKMVPNCVLKQKTFREFTESIDKSKMKCNSPKSDPVGDSLTGKSHVVKACKNGKEKIIRFGQRGVKGSPKKKGESKEYASRRKKFKARHSKNIAKGVMSAAYWADKVKW